MLQCSWCPEHNDDVEGASEFVAERCSVLQCVAVCGSVRQCVAVRGSAWQCVATEPSILYVRRTEHEAITATHRNSLQLSTTVSTYRITQQLNPSLAPTDLTYR